MIWLVPAGVAALGMLGYYRYTSPKVGDTVRGRNVKLGADVPGLPPGTFSVDEGTMLVRSIENGKLLGSFIMQNVDTKAPAMILKSDMIENLTPHL